MANTALYQLSLATYWQVSITARKALVVAWRVLWLVVVMWFLYLSQQQQWLPASSRGELQSHAESVVSVRLVTASVNSATSTSVVDTTEAMKHVAQSSPVPSSALKADSVPVDTREPIDRAPKQTLPERNLVEVLDSVSLPKEAGEQSALPVDDRNSQSVQNVAPERSIAEGLPLVVDPQFKRTPKAPRYPTVARKRGQSGTVLLDVWLDERGRSTTIDVSESSGFEVLDKAALKSVKRWAFQPHRISGIAVASRVRIPIEFNLAQ